MSFQISTSYERPSLRPLVLPQSDPSAGQENTEFKHSQSWISSTHTFRGTEDRNESTAWPPSRFNDDPAAIPDDEAHNIPYDASDKPNNITFELYAKQPKGDEASSVPPPTLVAKRYIPTSKADAPQGITLLTLTGMGVPKEMFEPILENLLPLLQRSSVKVEEVWAIDMPMCGETAEANPRGYLYANEKDIARDLLLFVTSYLPLRPGQDLPKQLLPRKPTAQTQQLTRENLHVFAHCLGAQASILASVHAPDVFSSLTLIDPAMIPAGSINDAMSKKPKDVLCLGLSEEYPDRDAVEKELRGNKRTQNWDDRAVRAFSEYGVVPNGTAGLRLATRPRLEWALWYDKQTPAECYDRFTDISVPLHMIMPKRPFAVPAKMLQADVSKLKNKTQVRWVDGARHHIVYEKMDLCADFLAQWLTEMAGKEKAHL